MLVLTRKLQQQILIGSDVVVTIHRIKGGKVRIGIEAPKSTSIKRAEIVPGHEPPPKPAPPVGPVVIPPPPEHWPEAWYDSSRGIWTDHA